MKREGRASAAKQTARIKSFRTKKKNIAIQGPGRRSVRNAQSRMCLTCHK